MLLFATRPESPKAMGLSRGNAAPSLTTGTITARSLRGSAAMISASNSCFLGGANDQLAGSAHHVKECEDLAVVADHDARPVIE